MFEVLKKEIQLGNRVKIFLISGQEPEGLITEISENYLVMKKEDEKTVHIFEKIIGGWEIISTSSQNHSATIDEHEVLSENPDTSNNERKDLPPVTESELESVETAKQIGVKILGKIDLSKFPPKKNHEVADQKTHRLSKISRDYELDLGIIGNKLRLLGYGGSITPNSKIPDVFYSKLRKEILREISLENSENFDVLGIRAKSIEQNVQIHEKVEIDIADHYLAANATIKRSGQKGFGYLTDGTGADYYFSFTHVEDDDLFEKLNSGENLEGIQVICDFNNFKGKMFATKIWQPKKISDLLETCKKLLKDSNFNDAERLIQRILSQYPNFSDALDLKKKIEYDKSKQKKETEKLKFSYNQAKIEIKRGNFDEAKKLLIRAINLNDFRSENALKELSYLLQREGDIDAAIRIVEEHQAKIKTSDPNNLLAYFFETKKDFSKALEYLLKVKPLTPNEELKLEKRKALAYFALSDYQNADKSIKFVLTEKPEDYSFQKLYDILEKRLPDASAEEIQAIFNEAQLITHSGGLSPFIVFSLENCEYKGLPKEILVAEKYDLSALKSIRNYIEKAAGNRPIEKAEFLLTEAKLMQNLTPEKERELNEILARRNMALAEASALTGKSTDILRFFLLEAFRLAPDISFVRPHLPIFFASFNHSSVDALDYHNKGWKDALKNALQKEENKHFWFGLGDLLISNSNISNSVLTYLFQNHNFRQKCYQYFAIEGNFKNEEQEKENFTKIWNEKLDLIKRTKIKWTLQIDSLKDSKSLESFVENYAKIVFPLPEWVNQIDAERLNLLNEIIKSCSEFLAQNSFEDKERYYSIITNQLSQLKSEIEESPTELSFNIFRKLLVKLDNLISSIYETLIETSKPEISISMLGEGVLNESDSLVNLQLNISNKKGSAPVSYLKVTIKDNEDLAFINENNVLEQTLKGGEDRILRMCVRVSEKIKKEEAANISLNCSYKIRGYDELYTFTDNLTMRLYTETDFISIANPFAATADSGPVTDPNMFYGREIFIENIKNSILDSASKCVIIYGQKRSGKSSVLYHLRENLIDKNEAFCISFSLGEIVENLSSLTFYYKVLSEIEDALDDMRDLDMDVPAFKAPSLSELKEAPSIIFNEALRNFNKSISKLPSWSNKKLILLLDEFTYIYTAIQKNILSNEFMKSWKSFLEKGYFTSVLIGQDIMPKFMEDYPNEFGVTEPKRLSYLDRVDAASLIEKPIWDDVRSRSRFLGKAVDYLLDYTSSNPYYIQIFCARLVEYMNYKKFISVTEADIIEVANSFISGEKSLSVDKFDNLLTAGDADLEAFKPFDVLRALKEIALASRNLDSCNVETINLGDKSYGEKILKDLKTREVLSTPLPDFYKINVRLFKEWLLIN